MKKKCSTPKITTVPVDLDKLGDVDELLDAQSLIKLEQFSFQKNIKLLKILFIEKLLM